MYRAEIGPRCVFITCGLGAGAGGGQRGDRDRLCTARPRKSSDAGLACRRAKYPALSVLRGARASALWRWMI